MKRRFRVTVEGLEADEGDQDSVVIDDDDNENEKPSVDERIRQMEQDVYRKLRGLGP